MASRACLRRLIAAAVAVVPLVAAKPASALEYHLVRWKKTGKCEVITTLPIFGNHWDEIAVYDTKRDADWALREKQRTRVCPPPDPPKPVVVKRKPRKPDTDQQEEDDFNFNPAGVW
ncbi:MAG: hypothetical protein M0006_14710 [Magnetospirillum sp.]|nr:hypothetical protein [Magnetospirillum sp.]